MSRECVNLKRKYNELIAIEHKAGAWLDNNEIPISEREAKIPEFLKLIKKLSEILNELKQSGVEISDDEILNGFQMEGDDVM